MMRLLPLLVAAAFATCVGGCTRADSAPATRAPASRSAAAVSAAWIAGLDSLVLAVERLDTAVAVATPDSAAALRAAFAHARAAYKRVEWLVEYYTPAAADGINGPALDDMMEDDPNRVTIAPEGFQVVEELLWPGVQLADEHAREDLRLEVRLLLANARRVRHGAGATPLTDAAAWDAARTQLVRIVTLGLAGFDSPVALRSVGEAADAVRALGDALAPYAADLRRADPALADTLARRLAAAEGALRAGAGDFDGFDRLGFITAHANPLADVLLGAQRALGVPLPPVRQAWRRDTPTPWAKGAIDPLAWAPAPQQSATPAQVVLGRALFFDPVLSRDGTRSCATCHQPARAFTDGLPVRAGGRAHGTPRNTPTVINAALQGATFADLRTAFLEDQVADVVRNADEMHGSLEEATAAVAGRAPYDSLFRRAYDGGVATPALVRRALAAYLRSLVALDAPFDRHVRGDTTAMTPEQRLGFNVFMGKGKCATCHFAPLFNGVVPPAYEKTEGEVLGVPARAATRGATVDPDLGRFRTTRLPIHRHAFKTPTLRNVELTAPYMHNGAYATLEQVIEFYDLGGGAGIGAELPNQTLPPDPLRLAAREKRALVAFMRALTDTTGMR